MKEPNSSFPDPVRFNHTGAFDYYDSWYWVWPTCLPVYLGTEVFNFLLGLVTNTWYLWLVEEALLSW
jgi:hypothetical protein